VEQKNWTWARQLLGYGRLENPELVAPISALLSGRMGALAELLFTVSETGAEVARGQPLAQTLRIAQDRLRSVVRTRNADSQTASTIARAL